MFSIVNQAKNKWSSVPYSGQRALVLISGSVNYYYDNIGKRVADGLRNIGFQVDVCTLRQASDAARYDWVFVNPVVEVAYPYGNMEEALRRIEQFVTRAPYSANILLECVQTHWFVKSWEPYKQTKIQTLFDLGLHDQRNEIPNTPPGMRDGYRFAYNGLTLQERQLAQSWLDRRVERPIPWVFVGHSEPVRIQFVQRLMNQLDKGGFVYMPQLTHITEDGPHMNASQMQETLDHAKYFIWRTHHDYFYMESERFRNALFSGCVPLKVMKTELIGGRNVPFRHLMIDEADMITPVRDFNFRYEEVRQAFIEEFLALPSMEDELRALVYEKSGVTV
jgi:hypothetical protein